MRLLTIPLQTSRSGDGVTDPGRLLRGNTAAPPQERRRTNARGVQGPFGGLGARVWVVSGSGDLKPPRSLTRPAAPNNAPESL